MYVVFESPLQMLADSPSNYLREPEAMEFLGPVPTVWDETRVLDAKIGEYVVVARRSGRDWYIGAMTNWTPRELEIDLSFLPAGTLRMEAYQDGVNAEPHGGRLQAGEEPGQRQDPDEDPPGGRRRLGGANPPVRRRSTGRALRLQHGVNETVHQFLVFWREETAVGVGQAREADAGSAFTPACSSASYNNWLCVEGTRQSPVPWRIRNGGSSLVI